VNHDQVPIASYFFNSLVELAFAYQATRDWPAMLDAATHAARAVRDSDGPNHIPFLCKAWHGMAYAQIELGRWDDAELALHKCLALDPDNVKARSELDYIAKARPKG
jgi:tetratricopeptide (TPR) repeat protein